MTHIALNAHLLSRRAGYRRAGIHRYIYHTLTNLPGVDDGTLRYTVLANHPLGLKNNRLRTQVSGFDTSTPWKRIVWEQLVQPVALRRLQPDIYHALAFVAPWYVPGPLVVTVYDLSFIRYPDVLTRARRLYLKTLTRLTCQRAARVIAISRSTADDLVSLLGVGRNKIDIAYPGVEADFQPRPAAEVAAFRQQKGLPDRFFFFLGTLEPRKNLPMLLRAYARLSAVDRAAVHLVLGGGKGWLYEEIFETITRLNLGQTVHTPGYIAPEDLPLWYNAAQALVYPPLYEGFGIPIVEALACGTPVLAADCSSLPEAAGPVSTLLPPDDEAAWAMAMQAIIDSPPQADDQRAARLDWASRFSWQDTARQTLDSYRRVGSS